MDIFSYKLGQKSGGDSGGGSAPNIVDVLELPTANIDEDAFYRTLKGSIVSNQNVFESAFYIVKGLPETGDPVTLDGQSIAAAYYNTLDEEVYGYLPDILASSVGVPAGWYSFSTLAPVFGVDWFGVISDISDCPTDNSMGALLQGEIWYYNHGWNTLSNCGWIGTGVMAEVFNHPSNVANGMYSHAEGRETTASGVVSHAEGYKTTASGAYSHAEGRETTASKLTDHAEGYKTTASGGYSHAEGSDTIASGESSHAEGASTTASGDCQHVQGRCNIPDEDNVYAHIVGNGLYQEPSNAHTLDWDGNAWYAGTVECTAVILTSPSGKKFKLTVDDSGTVSAVEVTE